jgi:hypothetical protein
MVLSAVFAGSASNWMINVADLSGYSSLLILKRSSGGIAPGFVIRARLARLGAVTMLHPQWNWNQSTKWSKCSIA